MSNQLDRMQSEGFIRKAVEELLIVRAKTWDESIDSQYEWSVSMKITEDIGFEFNIKEIIFTRFRDKNVTKEIQLEMLVAYIYNLVELDLRKEMLSIPRVSSIN